MALFDPLRTFRFVEVLGKLANTDTIDAVAPVAHSAAFLNLLSGWPETVSDPGATARNWFDAQHGME